MSDIVEIKPEKDFKKYKFEDVPAEPKPNNRISADWANGITEAVTELTPVKIDFPFSPGWFNYETSSVKEDGWVKCRMTKVGNRVFVEGLAKCNPDAKAQVGVLPSGWRPKSIHMFSCIADIKTSVNTAVRIDVMTDGRVIVNHGTNAGMTTPVVFVALEFNFEI